MTWRLLPAGERAVLVEVDDLDTVLDLDATLTLLTSTGERPWDAVVDRVPAARTLLVTVVSPSDLPAITSGLRGVLAALGVHFEAARVQSDATFRSSHHAIGRITLHTGGVVEISVTYDGPDLVPRQATLALLMVAARLMTLRSFGSVAWVLRQRM